MATTTVIDTVRLTDSFAFGGGTFKVNDGSIVTAYDNLQFTTVSAGSLSTGDTVVIDGNTYTISGSTRAQVKVTYNDDQDISNSVSTNNIELTSPGQPDIHLAIFPDQLGSTPNISEIQSFSPQPASLPLNVSSTSYDFNHTVSVGAPTGDALDYELYDIIEISGKPGTGQTLTLADMEEVADFAVVQRTADTTLGEGATITLQGVDYTLVDFHRMSVDVTDTNASTPVAGTNWAFMELEDASGNSRFFMMPPDRTTSSNTDYTDITQVHVNLVSSSTYTASESVYNNDDGVSVMPCFVRGTMIATLGGFTAIQDLKAGDKVMTRDNGLQEVRWIGSRSVAAVDKMAPVKFAAGALGHNEQDLWLSPNHRVLRTGWDIDMLFNTNEALIAAKHLVGNPGIQQVSGGQVEYFHILFDKHELVLSNNVWTESFHPGQEGMSAFDDDVRQEILYLFPHLLEANDFADYGATARTVLKSFEVNLLSAGNAL